MRFQDTELNFPFLNVPMLRMNETCQSGMDLRHTVDSTGRYSSNHHPFFRFSHVAARTGGGAAG